MSGLRRWKLHEENWHSTRRWNNTGIDVVFKKKTKNKKTAGKEMSGTWLHRNMMLGINSLNGFYSSFVSCNMHNTGCRLRKMLYIFSIMQRRNMWQKWKTTETFPLFMADLLCFICSRVCIWLYRWLILPVTVRIMKRTEEFPSSRWALFALGLLHSKLKHCCWYHTYFNYTNIQFPTVQVLDRKRT